MAQHPYGLQPWGNYLVQGGVDSRAPGLGRLRCLTDELILQILESLQPVDLVRLGSSSKVLYCFCTHEDLWKSLVLEHHTDFKWAGSWRYTCLCASQPNYQVPNNRPVVVQGVYSDLLYQPWFCATVDICEDWLIVDNIDRRSGLSLNEFRQQYELPNIPVVISDVVNQWPAHKKWSRDYLKQALGGASVIVGNTPMDFDTYLSYCDNNVDEMPLYLFDKAFLQKAPSLAKDFVVPDMFTEDLFEVLGVERRPDYRWLIMGPARSGSSFHVDPNCTSAWNACITGSKKWILFPPHHVPPGVHPSPDGADVATPVSIMEWFLNFYDATRESKVRPVECVVKAGELIFVPRGWWHIALNLEESIAITQNFVSSANLPHVLQFLRPGRPEMVSGLAHEDRASLHDRFVKALQEQRPKVLEAIKQQEQQRKMQLQQEHTLSDLFREQPSKQLAQAFTFGFETSNGDAADVGTDTGFAFKFGL